MSAVRLVIDYAEVLPGKIIKLSKEDKKYLFSVLRLAPGGMVFILDGKGKSFQGKIIDKDYIEILKEEEHKEDERFNLILCQALLKGEKMDLVIQKSTEIGVKKIIPFVSERCVLRKTNKIERWRRIAKEASEQSGRISIPEIMSVVVFDELIKSVDNGLLFWEKEKNSLIEVLFKLNLSNPLFLIIGPEGGFSLDEIDKALNKGIKIASLGKRILRAETAAIFSLSILSFLWENVDIIKLK
jgi:16S rRNA (uracil1498-N3)-methyltransferase